MTILQIKSAVHNSTLGFKRNERIAFQRYFMAYFFPLFKHEGIADLTDKCDRTSVCKTIKRISQNKYYPIRERILASLIVEQGKPGYQWLPRT